MKQQKAFFLLMGRRDGVEWGRVGKRVFTRARNLWRHSTTLWSSSPGKTGEGKIANRVSFLLFIFFKSRGCERIILWDLKIRYRNFSFFDCICCMISQAVPHSLPPRKLMFEKPVSEECHLCQPEDKEHQKYFPRVIVFVWVIGKQEYCQKQNKTNRMII